ECCRYVDCRRGCTPCC
uniref:Conotoxin ar3i n=1 Tax=Conus araneosus TaxID=101286 RepID=M3I_CONAO|nr:RecName: Full=Conotoxin ar3i; AltName: Full=Conotoxin ar3j [Conus araneosus]